MTTIAPTLQAFYTDWLLQQRHASTRTLASYRDTLRLLVAFVHQRTGKLPADLDWDDLDATVIVAFLDYLEGERRNGIRTRNARLTAIRSLFRYAALRHPEHAALIQRVLVLSVALFDDFGVVLGDDVVGVTKPPARGWSGAVVVGVAWCSSL